MIQNVRKDGTPLTLEQVKTLHIGLVLEACRGNRRQAALLLGIAKTTLLDAIRKHPELGKVGAEVARRG